MAIVRRPAAERSTLKKALADPCGHSFSRGLGYVRHGAPPTAPGPHPASRCTPPAAVEHNTYHFLTTPGGNRLVFRWLRDRDAWIRPGGRRMAFRDDYLSRAGWTYFGAAQTAITRG